MATINTEKSVTVKDVAERFGRNPSRIRQICIAHEIGELVGNRIRLLSHRDAERIGKILEEFGRKPLE